MSGFSSVCITETGRLGGKLLGRTTSSQSCFSEFASDCAGIVTSRDMDFVADRQTLLKDVMTECIVGNVLAPGLSFVLDCSGMQ